jgi:hypothetical protein
MKKQAFLTFAFSALLVTCATPCSATLIDDFSVAQAGIATDQYAAYDQVTNPDLLGGDRWIVGGGSSLDGACVNCKIAAAVSDGRFYIVPGADCPGSIFAQWGRTQSLGLNIAGDTAIQLDIAELTGIAQTRVSIYSGGYSAGHYNNVWQKDVFPSSIGTFTIPFSSSSGSIALQNINTIVVATYLDTGEFIAIDAVRTIPEPPTILLLALALACTVQVNARRKQPDCLIQHGT